MFPIGVFPFGLKYEFDSWFDEKLDYWENLILFLENLKKI